MTDQPPLPKEIHMNTKFVKTRKFVNDNRTLIAFCAGSVVTSALTAAFIGDSTLLRVTKEHAQMLKEGGAIVYELKDQTLHLINVPAVEAAQAAL
jgi:hypothetical protein